MNEIGYSPKNLHFGKEGRKKLILGIEAMSATVKSTLGPSGHTVLIESPNHTHGITVTKDGVTVAKEVDLIEPVGNLAIKMMKEASSRTATSAGDGTTTAIVITEALVKEGDRLIGDKVNKTEVLRELVAETKAVVSRLKGMSKAVTKGRLRDVATISSNNDTHIGGIISKVYKGVGKNGIVTVDRSQTSDTHFETTNGLKIERGFSSNIFITDQKKDECIFDDVYILVSDAEISNILQIENVLYPILTDNKKLLIIAPCSTNVVNTLAANKMKRDIKICTIPPPNFGYKQHELMQDIAISVGATYYSEKTGDDLSLIEFSDLGFAAKVVVDSTSTIIVKESMEISEQVAERVGQLREQHTNTDRKSEKEFILSRIASLTGGVGTIFVGGKTDLEHKELYDRVDDAVCAVRSALEEGILPGGGVALYYATRIFETEIQGGYPESKRIAREILTFAMKAPLFQIYKNAGIELDHVMIKEIDTCIENMGMNVKTGEWGDMYKMGVIDPLKVTKSALQNAVSVAISILSTNAIITLARTYEAK